MCQVDFIPGSTDYFKRKGALVIEKLFETRAPLCVRTVMLRGHGAVPWHLAVGGERYLLPPAAGTTRVGNYAVSQHCVMRTYVAGLR